MLTNGGETERNWLPFALTVVMCRTWSRVLYWASLTRWGLCVLTFPSALLRRMAFLLKSEIFGVKIYLQGSDEAWHCLSSISCPERWVDSRRKLTLNLYQIQLLSFSKPQRLKIRISEKFWIVSVSEKGAVSAGWWIRSKLCSNRNSELPVIL